MRKYLNTESGGLNVNSYISIGLFVTILGAAWFISAQVNGASSAATGANSAAISARDAVTRLETKVNGMDGMTQANQQVVTNNTGRITKLEDQNQRLVPDVAAMKTDLSWIADWVKAQKHK